MATKSRLIENLVAQASVVNPADYFALIKKTASLLRREQKDLKTKRDGGRLLCLTPSGTAIIVGDIHGDLASLTYILKDSGFIRKAQLGKNVHLIFLGDYGDRGMCSSEVYYVVLKLKELFPQKVVLMRGNHEGPMDMIPCPFDLPEQFRKKFGPEVGERLIIELFKLFNRLYTSVIIENRAILSHGGLPSNATSLEDLVWAQKRHPQNRDLEELLWSDPKDQLVGTTLSPRGAGRVFGIDITERLLRLFSVKVLIRGHECCQDGFRFNHSGQVLTLFSTNKYRYFNQYAAYLKMNLRRKITDGLQLQKSIKQFE